MTDYVLSIEGTPAGQTLAMLLALNAAFLHALLSALQKGRFDPWIARAGIDTAFVVLALPVALFVVTPPQGAEWALFAGAAVIHLAYKVGVALAFTRGAYTVVYPVVRGVGPLCAILGAWVVFGERFGALQWLGVAILMAGLFGLAATNLVRVQAGRDTLVPALWFAVGTGVLVAAYTTYGAFAIRAMPDPFTFVAWFFVLCALDMPLVGVWRIRTGRSPMPDLRGLVPRSFLGALAGFGSFGGVMLATRLDDVGEAAVLRETSVVFAAALGWLFLNEPIGVRRLLLMGMIAAGAVLVELGG